MKQSRFALLMGALLAFSLLLASVASAHPVAVNDSSRIDWFAVGPSAPNVGEIARDAAGRGEFVWTDARGDQRVANPIGSTGNITREADLARLNITADTTNLYVLARVDRLSGITNDPSPELMVAIDSDATHTAGSTALPDGLATVVDANAKWEYAIQTQFTKTAATAKPKLYTSDVDPGTVCNACAAQLVSAAVRQGSFMEIAIPWSQIGGMPAPQNTLRFTVLTHYSDKRAPADGLASKAIDVLSPLGTAAELSDGAINAYVELHFNASGEVFAPLLISEFLPDPPTNSDPVGEWIEIYNPNSFDVSLNGYKIGDQAYRGGSQGMLKLPNQVLLAGTTLVIANGKSVFQSRYPGVPANQIVDMTALAPYTAWATGSISLQNTNNGSPFKESIALLDPQDTLIDLVQYTTPVRASGLDPDNQPIVLSGTSVAPNASYDRCPSYLDTNNSQFDFVVHTAVLDQTPGQVCQGVPGVDLRASLVGPAVVTPGSTIQYTIGFNNAGTGPSSAANVVVTDTLPLGLTFVSQSSTAAGLTFNGTGADGRSLSWSLASLAPGAGGSITVLAAVDAALPLNTILTSTAGVTSSSVELPENRANNVTMYTTITEGPPDVTISSTWPETAAPTPGSLFTYTITYANIGADDATDVTLVDTLPPGVTLVEASASDGSFNNATSGNLVWNLPVVTSLSQGSIALTVRIGAGVAPGTVLTNQITIASNPADSPTTNNAETKALTVGKFTRYVGIVMR